MALGDHRHMYSVAAVVAAAAGLGALAVAASSRMTAASRAHAGKHNGRIFFVDKGDQISSMNRHGGGRRQLTKFENEFASEPAVSPNGKTVAFVQRHNFRRGTLWTMHVDGSHQRRLTPRPGRVYSPTFSPDGDHIAFSTGKGISVIRAKGGKAHELINGFDPAYSPDGKKLLYTDNLINLHVLDLSSGRSRPLHASLVAPAYSPDGRWIVGYSSVEVYKMRADGTHVQRLAHGLEPSFSPSGKQILYTAIGPKLSVMRAGGSHRRTIGPGSEGAWAARR
jgi:Tol biopolymer transport system component